VRKGLPILFVPVTLALVTLGVVVLRRNREPVDPLPGKKPSTSDITIALPAVAPDKGQRLLGLLQELRDALTKEAGAEVARLSKELAALGDWAVPHMVHAVLNLETTASQPILTTLMEPFPKLPAANAILEQTAALNWYVLAKEARKRRLLIASRMLQATSLDRSSIDLSALLHKYFDAARAKTGRVALAILAVRLRLDGWLSLVRKVLSTPGDSDACDELIETMGEALDADGSTALLALFFERDFEKYKGAIAQAVGRVLPADEALLLLLGAAQAESSPTEQLAIGDVIERMVGELPNGMDLVRSAWLKMEDKSARLSILTGLGGLKTRADVGEFLVEVCKSPVETHVSGTALISLSRLDTHRDRALSLCLSGLSAPPGKDADEQFTFKMSSVFSFENLYRRGLYPLETVQAYRQAFSSDKDPQVVRALIESAAKMKMVQLNEDILKLGSNHPDASVREAARQFLGPRK
jgi:hypothetical protein